MTERADSVETGEQNDLDRYVVTERSDPVPGTPRVDRGFDGIATFATTSCVLGVLGLFAFPWGFAIPGAVLFAAGVISHTLIELEKSRCVEADRSESRDVAESQD